jgi:hypothetical protein
MRVRVTLAFRSYAVGQVLPDIDDATARMWIARNLVVEDKGEQQDEKKRKKR